MRRRWVTSAGTIGALAAIDADVAARAFGTSDAIALGGWPGATSGRAWASAARFAEDVAAGTIGDDVAVAMYDPERWDATPEDERCDPIGAIERFCALARSRGYTILLTPHPNLVEVPGSACAMRPGESREEAYLRSGIVEVSAAGADLVETQAQRYQRDPPAYRAFVLATARRARAMNPDVAILSGLSTHPGYPATAEMLLAAWRSVGDVVDGHYLSLAKGRRCEVAVAFLAAALAERSARSPAP